MHMQLRRSEKQRDAFPTTLSPRGNVNVVNAQLIKDSVGRKEQFGPRRFE